MDWVTDGECEMMLTATDGQVCSSRHQQPINTWQQFW